MHHTTDKVAHTTACYTSRGALVRETAEGSIHRPMSGDAQEALDLNIELN